MPLILIDTDNAEWRERAEKKLQKQGFSEHQAFGAVTSILATGTPLDDAAVERAADAVYNADNGVDGDTMAEVIGQSMQAECVTEGGPEAYRERIMDLCRVCARAALEAAAKKEK